MYNQNFSPFYRTLSLTSADSQKETEENVFVFIYSVAWGSEGSHLGLRWVVYHTCLWTRSLEMWEMLPMGNFAFHFPSLCIKS